MNKILKDSALYLFCSFLGGLLSLVVYFFLHSMHPKAEPVLDIKKSVINIAGTVMEQVGGMLQPMLGVNIRVYDATEPNPDLFLVEKTTGTDGAFNINLSPLTKNVLIRFYKSSYSSFAYILCNNYSISKLTDTVLLVRLPATKPIFNKLNCTVNCNPNCSSDTYTLSVFDIDSSKTTTLAPAPVAVETATNFNNLPFTSQHFTINTSSEPLHKVNSFSFTTVSMPNPGKISVFVQKPQ